MKSLLLIIGILLTWNSAIGQLQDYTKVDSFAKGLKFTTDYKSVVSKIQDKFDDEELVVRAIFTWIVDNIEYDQKVLAEFEETGKRGKTQFSGSAAEIKQQKLKMIDGKVSQALKKKKGVCQDFSWILEAMTTAAGIESVFISGFGRTHSGTIGKVYNRGNHAWNAIKVNEEWSLFDATWSTGNGITSASRKGFFMMKPELFIHSHHPTDSEWQLLNEPIDKIQFAELAIMHPPLIEFGLEEIQTNNVYISAKEENVIVLKTQKPLDKIIVLDGKSQTVVEPELKDGKTVIKYKAKRPIPRVITISTPINGELIPLMSYKMKM